MPDICSLYIHASSGESMKRVLLTGMSGTGKSTLTSKLAARGYKAIDADADEWSEWVAGQ